tara:strand:- start:1882 stop:2112 length:231 start_codon:yes stop_codon:yes gene_type:complete
MFNEQSILIPFFFSQLPFALLLFVIGCFKVQTNTEPPIATVEIVEEEIEIEYVNTDIWSQWVFDTDSGVEYINLRE